MLALTAAALMVLTGVACSSGGGEHAVPAPAYRLAAWPQSAPSPGFNLVDADGAARSLQDYRGKVAVVFFGFLRCPGVCSAEMHRLALVTKQLGARAAGVQVLFITLDPARDNPKLLKAFVQAFDPGFVALTGTIEQLNQATSAFHVQYAHVPEGGDYTIAHSTSTSILDDTGRLRLVAAADSPTADLVHDITLLLDEAAQRANAR